MKTTTNDVIVLESQSFERSRAGMQTSRMKAWAPFTLFRPQFRRDTKGECPSTWRHVMESKILNENARVNKIECLIIDIKTCM